VLPFNGTRVSTVFSSVFALCIGSAAYSAEPKRVAYPSTDPFTKMRIGDISIAAHLWKPAGNGPFATIIAVHGCNGPGRYMDGWIQRFQQWGYVVARPNSLQPRGLSTTCTSKAERAERVRPGASPFPTGAEFSKKITRINPQQRVYDVADTLRYLQTLPFVDKERVAVVGWSHGGDTAVLAAEEYSSKSAFDGIAPSLRGVVSFYPMCYFLAPPKFKTPLLVLVGDKDEWASAGNCERHVKQRQSMDVVADVVVYPNTYHGFDSPGANVTIFGYRVLYNEKAHRDAIERVRRFLSEVFRR